jgi:serine/threonine protein kinase/Tol biopolymer transport system component
MTLSPGVRLGPYEIAGALGAGGMGEVFRARDTKLNREVAIKVLPAAFADDPERLARFTREAQTLASLNHPSIATIYGIEEIAGIASADASDGRLEMTGGGGTRGASRALVMELIEGEDLSARIARGPIPIAEALPIARQIAEALEAAHEQGIVHRDLKPANIKLRTDGTVKVLDFGLAKATDPAGASSSNPNISHSPTLTHQGTMAGMIIGTAAYMSPEQAKGKPVDKRTDIWAFGVVLYEMLTGRRAFKGEDVSETLAAVLMTTLSMDALPSTTPPAIVSLIRRCLARDPRNRLRDIGDARLVLVDDAHTTNTAPTGTIAPVASRVPWVVAAGATLALLALAAWTFSSRAVPTESRAIVTTLLPPANGEFAFTIPYAMPAISPDGTGVVYGARDQSGKQQLWLRQLDSPTARALPGTEDAATPFWAPDNRWVGFGQGNKLKKIDVQGGPPVAVADLPSALRGGSWNSQGVIVVGVMFGPILRVAASGGGAVPIAGTDGRHPWFLPDGRHFLYQNARQVRVVDLNAAGTSGKPIVETDSPAVYSEGHLLYLRGNTLMAQPFDTGRLETMGDAVSVADAIPTFTTGSRIPGFAVSPAGLLVYQSGGAGTKSLLVWKDRQGKELGALPEARIISGMTLSPDGTRVAVAQWDLGTPTNDLWIYALDRGIPTRVTSSPENDVDPVWSPDGTMLYFGSNPNGGPYKIFRKSSNGTGKVELVLEDSASVLPSGISPDGKLLLYRGSGGVLRALPLNGASGDRPAKPYEFPEIRASRPVEFSPDGRWLVYESNDGVYAAPFPGPGTRIQISRRGGSTPRWGKDGNEIFFADNNRSLMAVDVAVRNGTLEIGEPRALFGGIVTSSTGASAGITYDVSRDSQRILVFDDGASATAQPLTLVQHWTALLRGASR